MKKKTTAKAAKPAQAEIKARNEKKTRKQTGQTTQVRGHLKAMNKRNQGKRDSRG